ncbi:MAG: hypothetical protein CL878_00140 [Dehalococcoidia bacterium]|nr:hypothetical protein [Dehalococcoidia bacterium]
MEAITAAIGPQFELGVLRGLSGLRVRSADRVQATERLSRGARVLRAADDPGAASRAVRLRAEQRGQLRAARNTQIGLSILDVAGNAVSDILTELRSIRDLVEKAEDDQLETTTRRETQRRLEIVKDHVGRLIDQATFADVPILRGDGGSGDLLVFVEASPVVQSSVTLRLPNLDQNALGGTGTGSLSAVGVRTGADASAALAVIDQATDQATLALGQVQGQETRLHHSQSVAQFFNTAAREAADATIAVANQGFKRVRPLDFPRPPESDPDPFIELRPRTVPTTVFEAVRLSNALIATRAGSSVLAQANVDARSTLRLLEPGDAPLPPFAAALPGPGEQPTIADLLGLPSTSTPPPQLAVR